MNGLALRISKGGHKKCNNSIGFPPVTLPDFVAETFCKSGDVFKDCLQSPSVDEQLSILKGILEGSTDAWEENTINFLVVLFFYADLKHPVKCYIVRYVTKKSDLQSPFSNSLAAQIINSMNAEHLDYKTYINVVSKLAPCIENFPAGTIAIKSVEFELTGYLQRCLKCCVITLSTAKTLAPTEKNEIFNLAHLSIRILLHIVQKINHEDINKTTSQLQHIRSAIRELMFDEDAPMDTKSVCGILYLNMHVLEHGDDSWVDFLQSNQTDVTLSELLNLEASQLSLYSAVPTVISVPKLQDHLIDGEPAIIVLTQKILMFGERCSSESIFTLGVTRTLLQISRGLDKVTNTDVGLKLVDSIQVFVWSHLEHYMDSVRHLTAQILANVVRYCTKLKINGNSKALQNLFIALTTLDRTRKSYYVGVTSLVQQLGASCVIAAQPGVIRDVIDALSLQAVQASATTSLEVLLQKHVQETNTETMYRSWIEPILSYVTTRSLESGVLNVLENLLAKAVKLDGKIMDFILPHIKQSTTSPYDMKCILMLLSVARKAGATERVPSNEEVWKGIIRYEELKRAAVDANDETRILSLSLIVESPKTTEVFSRGDFKLVLYYLKYNINAQSPNYRQLTLSMMKKFIKRLEDSYKVFKKDAQSPESDYYVHFLEELRCQCFESLMPGANYSRRFVALQTLVWCERVNLGGYEKVWNKEYVEKLLLHLEDSYENNKAFALEILEKCPVELLEAKSYSTSLDIEDIIRQASALKPTECVSAAYKLKLLRNKLPQYVLTNAHNNIPDEVTYTLLYKLQTTLRAQLAVCKRSIVDGARRAPMYGLIHCMGHLAKDIEANAISTSADWAALISDIIETCFEVNASVASVVNNSSPEGHLPMDMGVVVTDHGNSGGVTLDDGRLVTAQMVLLCAWRSVKEVSLLLGQLSALHLSHRQMALIGAHFTQLLAETKHRGAFEQAYVGFTKLLAVLWRSRDPFLHELPRAWLDELMAVIASGEKKDTLCATRRSAGLPFMIQALVTTELQVRGNPKCFHACMTTLLHLARTPTTTIGASETRTHSVNILRALFRNAALDESVGGYVGAGLRVALEGFRGGTWMERNSSTLLFSALMVRVFGVQRSRDGDNLCVRNRMTGRIFFLRYPEMYDFMLDKLKEVGESGDTQINPSLYPILLLLARLYPSSLEGTVSNLKLVAFIPHVLACARSAILKTRQLAAKAMVPLIAPHQYISHLEEMLLLISDKNIKRNYCHGILLQKKTVYFWLRRWEEDGSLEAHHRQLYQRATTAEQDEAIVAAHTADPFLSTRTSSSNYALTRLLDAKPDSISIDVASANRLQITIKKTLWILEQATQQRPCYLIADEYVKVVNLLLIKFPYLLQNDEVISIDSFLHKLIFNECIPQINSGRDICISNAIYLYFLIIITYNTKNISQVICMSLTHKSYEAILAALNFLLILNESLEIENRFQEHLSKIKNRNILKSLRENPDYISSLCKILKCNKYQECIQKTLKVLTLEENAEKYIVCNRINYENVNDDVIIKKLITFLQNKVDNVPHIYLESLSNFVTKKLHDSNMNKTQLLGVIRETFACSSSDNDYNTRSVVVAFFEQNFEILLQMNLDEFTDEEKKYFSAFEYKATIYATTIRLLEDDDATLRQRTSNFITKSLTESRAEVLSTVAGDILIEFIARDRLAVELLTVVAMLDFESEVRINDEDNDECRVFDQNERYNIFLEETFWTNACADKIIQLRNESSDNTLDFLQDLVQDPLYNRTFEHLCGITPSLLEEILEVCHVNKSLTKREFNPNILLFIDKLMGHTF